MAKIKKAERKQTKALPAAPTNFLSGITRAFSNFTGGNKNSNVWNVVSNTAKFTRSGVVTVGSWAWYFVTTAMVVVFPIRRAIEMDALMEEERQREAQRFNPDTVLPNVPGLYPSGSGISSVPISPRY